MRLQQLLLSPAADTHARTALLPRPQADFVDPLPEGCPHSRQAVIGHYLAFIKEYLQEQLRRTYGQKFMSSHTIKYCFTIPAGWSEEAKFLMRQ